MDYDNMYNQEDSRFVSNSYIAYPYQGQNLNQGQNFLQGQARSFNSIQGINQTPSQGPNIANVSTNGNVDSTQVQSANPIRLQEQDMKQIRVQTPGMSQIPNQMQFQSMPNQIQNQLGSSIDNSIAQNTIMMNNQNVREELISLPEAINLIKKSVGDEKEDEMFYDSLIKSAPNAKAVEIITSIRDDERKHNSILRFIYYRLTGIILQSANNATSTDATNSNTQTQSFSMNKNASVASNQNVSSSSQMASQTYKNNLAKALFGELDAVAKYRKIMGAMPDSQNYTLIMSIMTDELRHANKYNYLIHSAG